METIYREKAGLASEWYNEMDVPEYPDREAFLVATAEFLKKIRSLDVDDALAHNGDVQNDNFLRFFSAYMGLNRNLANLNFQEIIEYYELSEYNKLLLK